ncbi:39171_t:CDS:2, partial [Gigaspora margarita]
MQTSIRQLTKGNNRGIGTEDIKKKEKSTKLKTELLLTYLKLKAVNNTKNIKVLKSGWTKIKIEKDKNELAFPIRKVVQ